MERFTHLCLELEQTTRTHDKLAALERYFSAAPPADAAWGLFFLTGRKIKRVVNAAQLRQWAAEEANVPPWLVDECYDAVGDVAETLALLLPEAAPDRTPPPLHRLVNERLLPMRSYGDEARRVLLVETWRLLNRTQRLVWNKLITGEFRVGVARTLVVRALAGVSGVTPAEMDHRLMGDWEPAAAAYSALVAGESAHAAVFQPYPFFLASQLGRQPESLGPVENWQVEWKWDGIRAQLIRRRGQVALWSRGEELVTHQFPEVRRASEGLPDGTVLDGEILAWEDDRPLPFSSLQRRLGRKTVQGDLFDASTVVFLAFDLLEAGGEDWRGRPLAERRRQLEVVVAGTELKLSPVIAAETWEAVGTWKERARDQGVEGLMLKRLDSAYGVGRPRGPWWKWKADPYTVDAVMIYAQRGHGRRASLFTDYTFGVWDRGELTPVAKAYSGLSDEEIREVDEFVRANTIRRKGPVHAVRPQLVFELAFERIQASKRHRSGVAVRFPRIARWRRDKRPEEADTLAVLEKLVKESR
jgi:DNA ligase-1